MLYIVDYTCFTELVVNIGVVQLGVGKLLVDEGWLQSNFLEILLQATC